MAHFWIFRATILAIAIIVTMGVGFLQHVLDAAQRLIRRPLLAAPRTQI